MRRTSIRRMTIWTLSVVALVVAASFVGVGCGDDDDGVESTTTESAESTAPAGDVEPTTTAAAETEDDGATASSAAAAEISLSDFEGTWEGASYTVTSVDDPALTVDLVAAGATLTGVTDTSGNLTGQLVLPESLGGPMTFDFTASIVIVDEDTLTATFVPEIPPLLTSFTGPFTLDGDTLTLTDEDAAFDFADGNGAVPVVAEAVFVRS